MNAYNLADELDNIDAYEKHQILLGKSADMLRQQQAKIEELKAKFQSEFNYAEKLIKAQNEQ
jgi:hypothetical protein